jgi:protein phosphatase
VNTAFEYLSSADLTDVGRRRKNNEDSLIRLPEAGVFCVADGMGGVQGGEVASKAAVDALQKEFGASPDAPYAVTADASARLVERALNSASHWIKERAEGLGLAGTGSTAVVIVFDKVTPSQGIALHAGDSRAYRLRDDKLVQLTVDHSVAAAAGLPDDSSLPAMFRGVITRAVGLDRRVQLEATPFDVAPHDIFLLCSDGLSKMVSDRRIQKLLRKHYDEPLPDMARALVEEALKEGGEDNVSVVLVRVAQDLPKGPTMEIPEETLTLEKLVVVDEAAPLPAFGEDHDATGQTADTGAGIRTASTMADAATPSGHGRELQGITPDTPASDGNRSPTPVTPVQARARPPAASSSSSGLKWVVGGVVLFTAVVAAAWFFMDWQASRTSPLRQAGEKPAVPAVVPTNDIPLPVEPVVPEHHAAEADIRGGAQE